MALLDQAQLKTGLHHPMFLVTLMPPLLQVHHRIIITELPTIQAPEVQVSLRLPLGQSLTPALLRIAYLIFGILPATIPEPLIQQKEIHLATLRNLLVPPIHVAIC